MVAIADGQEVAGLKPRVTDVVRAREWLSDRGWGRAPHHALADGDSLSTDALDQRIAQTLEELTEQRLRKLGLVRGSGGADQMVPYIDFSRLDNDDLAQLRRILEKGQPDPKELPKGGRPAHELLPGA